MSVVQSSSMEILKQAWKQNTSFFIHSDYFYLVDRITLLFAPVKPLSTKPAVRVAWASIQLVIAFQYVYLTANLWRVTAQPSRNIDEFMGIFDLCITMTVALARGFCLTYYRQPVLQLKKYINSKSCLREDAWAFELRRKTYRKNNKFLVIFMCYTIFNACNWYLTEFRSQRLFAIPLPLDRLPKSLENAIININSVMGISWGVVLFISLTQFATILHSLHAELMIIVHRFEYIFEETVSKFALDVSELTECDSHQKDMFWEELDNSLKIAISHHSNFIRHHQQLKTVTSVNFFILLSSATVMVTVNMFQFIVEPSLARLPLQVVAIQFLLEIYVSCALFHSLEHENFNITRHVYAIDWFNALRVDSEIQKGYIRSIRQNVLLMQQQLHGGLTVWAGGMFPLNCETFSKLLNLVYSMLTFLLKSYKQ